MFRINRVTPFKLPSVLGWLGPLRLEFFLGQLEGHQFINGRNGIAGSFLHTIHPQPLIHGERFTFKPTRNFEFGFSRTGIFAGQGVPFTLHTFEKSFFGLGNGTPGTLSDPGDRRSGMDWTYRVPKMRDWVTFYGDAFRRRPDFPNCLLGPLRHPRRSLFLPCSAHPEARSALRRCLHRSAGGRSAEPRFFLLQCPLLEWLHQPGTIARQLDRARGTRCPGMGRLLVWHA